MHGYPGADLAGASDTESSEEPITALSTLGAQHTLHHGAQAGAMEQVELCCLLFKDPGELESLDSLPALIVSGRVDCDVRGCCFVVGGVDVEESLCIGGERWS